MLCSYHPSNAARIQCSNCARPLCAACDHRIKGYPYCQDCIVLGIDNLSQAYRQNSRPKRRARLAALCALLPGMGAVYNRQNVKAIAHFVAIVGLFQLSDLHFLDTLFSLAGFLFYGYSIIDAYRTAVAIGEGESPAVNEARFKKSLARRAPAIGMFLIIAGVAVFVQLMHPLGIHLSLRLLPVALIILGGYLLTRHFKRSRDEDYGQQEAPRPLYALPGHFNERHSEHSKSSSRPFNAR